MVIGVWERADIKAAVADGKLRRDDRYFAQGMGDWLPLSTLTSALSSPKRPGRNTPPSGSSTFWQRTMTSAGCAFVLVAGFSAIIRPDYLTQALMAAAGLLLVAAARTLQ